MNVARLSNGYIVTAKEYSPTKHGTQLFCIDRACQSPVIFVSGGKNTAHFKTTGKLKSKHTAQCGFLRPLTFHESIAKMTEYQKQLKEAKGKTTIRLNMSKIDPEYKPKKTPQKIESVKDVTRLLTSFEPDELAGIQVKVSDYKIPLTQMVLSSDEAHKSLWDGKLNNQIPYFVYGKISKVARREKVYYINLEQADNSLFTLIVFDKHFKYFTYTDEQLVNQDIIVYGFIRKNKVMAARSASEIVIKSNDYLDFITNTNEVLP
ncbi:hypothetical protein [Pueribacillus sp. YX66]|uniref:hypothetical protein n=1 Tax=Pueribacillus sp. YX66 TaxID=3229242 RepID=UPI00358D6A76